MTFHVETGNIRQKFLNILDVVDFLGRWPEAGVAGVFTSGVGAAGGWHSDGLSLLPSVVLTDKHHTHIHADVTPLERLAYLQQIHWEISLKKTSKSQGF